MLLLHLVLGMAAAQQAHPVHSVPGSPISSRPASSSATTALKLEHQRSSSHPSPSAADNDTITAVSAAIHLLQQQHQQQLRRCSQQQQWQQQQSPAGSQACLQQEEKPLTKAQLAALKRKAPEVNWRSIQVGCLLQPYVCILAGCCLCSCPSYACKQLIQHACSHVVTPAAQHAASMWSYCNIVSCSKPAAMQSYLQASHCLVLGSAILVDLAGLCWPGWLRVALSIHYVTPIMLD